MTIVRGPTVGFHERMSVHSANSFAEIRSTISGISRPKRKAPKARAVLSAFASEYRRRERELEQVAEQLRDDRDQAIRAAYDGGMAMSDVAAVMELSHQRVSQIVRS